MWSQKSDLVILMGLFQLRIFYDSWQSMVSYVKFAFFAPVEHRKYIYIYIYTYIHAYIFHQSYTDANIMHMSCDYITIQADGALGTSEV